MPGGGADLDGFFLRRDEGVASPTHRLHHRAIFGVNIQLSPPAAGYRETDVKPATG